jgi:hypothetical protein
VVQPWMPGAAAEHEGVLVARRARRWFQAPRMCRSRRIGKDQLAPRP